mmetsp:Transcript_33159/g.82517  ORF Transcript_33159/g.82517 Transcript_33159/m.82517 type:complete len:247 (-) Transcript_33159:397-1137(-)
MQPSPQQREPERAQQRLTRSGLRLEHHPRLQRLVDTVHGQVRLAHRRGRVRELELVGRRDDQRAALGPESLDVVHVDRALEQLGEGHQLNGAAVARRTVGRDKRLHLRAVLLERGAERRFALAETRSVHAHVLTGRAAHRSDELVRAGGLGQGGRDGLGCARGQRAVVQAAEQVERGADRRDRVRAEGHGSLQRGRSRQPLREKCADRARLRWRHLTRGEHEAGGEPSKHTVTIATYADQVRALLA